MLIREHKSLFTRVALVIVLAVGMLGAQQSRLVFAAATATLSGNTGVGGAAVKYGYGLFTTADNSGNYSIDVPSGWSGTVVPTRAGYSFTPAQRTYTDLQTNQPGQNYSAALNSYTYPGSPGETRRISTPPGGGQADGYSDSPSISADGRYVAYVSQAANIVAGHYANDIFVYDSQTGQTTSASVQSDGTPFDCNSFSPSISADGRYVAFTSCMNGGGMYWIVYVFDRHTGKWDSVARGYLPSISADGRYVAYLSDDNSENQFRVFVEDVLTRVGTQVSVSTTGGQPDGDSLLPSISADGRYVAFHSAAGNLVSDDTNGVEDVFVYDLQEGKTLRVSVHSNGTQSNGASYAPTISADGRYVVFHSAASNLVSSDTNAEQDVFVHDLQTGGTIRVSVSTDGTQANNDSYVARISADGRYVAFSSVATNLVSGDTNAAADVFLHELGSGKTRRVSVSSDGAQGNADSPPVAGGFSLSGDGTYLAFTSDATNLITPDTGIYSDVFLHHIINPASTFEDVSAIHWAWDYVERLYDAGITSGCSINPMMYCPENTVTRAEMAVFLERGIHGSLYTPPPAGGSTGFTDVAATYWSAAWIKQLAVDGITSGCGGGNYCPDSPVTRAQMAVFLLKSKHGAGYTPPSVGAGTGFGDVEPAYWAAAWIKQLAAEGITGGCGGGNYCPESPVTRAQMAVFLVKTFNLP